MVALKPTVASGRVKLTWAVLTDFVLPGLNSEGELLVGVLRGLGLLSHFCFL